jgi:hypothetical protein
MTGRAGRAKFSLGCLEKPKMPVICLSRADLAFFSWSLH